MAITLPRPRTDRTVERLHRRLRGHGIDLPLRLWDGRTLGPADADWRLHLKHPWSLRSMLLPPDDLSAGEAYLHDDIDVEGSMVAAIEQIARLRASGLGALEQLAVGAELLLAPKPPERDGAGGARLRGALHSPVRDRDAVQHHYDVGNELYELFLDDELVYSCAYFDDADHAAPPGDRAALTRAQVRKLDLVCRKLRLRPDERFLDIGCGWGSLVLHAARHYGVHAVGVTLSEQQAALARRRIADAGLAERVEIRLQDERDVTGTFDAVASVGMVEHVGPQRLADYFSHLFELTTPDGGRMLNHGITTGRRDLVRDLSAERRSFVATYVFPDGGLVPAHHAVREVQAAGFDLLDVEQLRPHYARTLRHWVANLEANADVARERVGETPYRVWRAYMAGSAVSFGQHDLGVVQVLAGRDAEVPLGRDWMRPVHP